MANVEVTSDDEPVNQLTILKKNRTIAKLQKQIEELNDHLRELEEKCLIKLDQQEDETGNDEISTSAYNELYKINNTYATRTLILGISSANIARRAVQRDLTLTPNKCGPSCKERAEEWKNALTGLKNMSEGNDLLGYIASGTVVQNSVGFLMDKAGVQGGANINDDIWNRLYEYNKVYKTYAARCLINTIGNGNSAWKKSQLDVSIRSGLCGPLCEKRSAGWKDAIDKILKVTKNNNLLGYLGLADGVVGNTLGYGVNSTMSLGTKAVRGVNSLATSASKGIGLFNTGLNPAASKPVDKSKKGWFGFGGSRKRRNTRKRRTRRSKYA